MQKTETQLRLCIIKPNKVNYSEPFIEAHIERLPGDKKVVYGGFFPLFRHDGSFLIRNKLKLIPYLIQKRILGKQSIRVRDDAFVSYLKSERIDVVLAEYGPAGALVTEACRRADVPLVIHYHGFDAHDREAIAAYETLYRESYAYASAVIGVSKDMCKAIQLLGCPPEKIVYNPYGVDLRHFQPVNVAASPLNFLSVARFAEKKAPHLTIRAFAQVQAQYPEARLIMAGTGPLWEQSKKLAAELNLGEAIEFAGVLSHEQVYERMKTSRAFVQHSVTAARGDSEGTPNSILEAAAAGLPAVSTRHAGIKEAVVHEKTGFLVGERDVDGMVRYMSLLAGDAALAARLGANARAHMEENYSFDQRIGRLWDVIVAAAQRRTGR
ncbi:MAG: glycosyltransferase [Solitalea sp.]